MYAPNPRDVELYSVVLYSLRERRKPEGTRTDMFVQPWQVVGVLFYFDH